MRKRNKALVDGTRVDLSLVVDREEEVPERGPFRKHGMIVVRALVTDATSAFDHPARYRVEHDEVSEVVSFTPTYAGQAMAGEMIEASGWLEEDADRGATGGGGDEPGGGGRVDTAAVNSEHVRRNGNYGGALQYRGYRRSGSLLTLLQFPLSLTTSPDSSAGPRGSASAPRPRWAPGSPGCSSSSFPPAPRGTAW